MHRYNMLVLTKLIKIFSTIFLLVALGAYLILTRKNIHQIGSEPVIYRSAQLKADYLEDFIEEKNIDIILNLRGVRDQNWYHQEKALTEKLGIEYYSYGFPKDSLPSRKRLLKMLDLLDRVKAENKNLLLHCKAGADRSGFLSAIAQFYLYGKDFKEAQKELSLIYGHLPDPEGSMEQVLALYKPYAAEMSFRDWVTEHYRAGKILENSRKPLFRL